MKRWGLICVAVLTLILGLTLISGAQEAKDEEFVKTLIAQSPWQGTWQGLGPRLKRPIAGTFELLFKMADGKLTAVIQNTEGSATTTKFDGPVTDLKIKGQKVAFKGEAGTSYELQFDKRGNLVGSALTPRGTPLDVEFRPAKK